MYTFTTLQEPLSLQYESFTFPKFRSLLQDLGANTSIVAITAAYVDQPVGLALALLRSGSNSAEILSICVAPEHRSNGVGTNLLTKIEKELAKRGCTKADLVYMTGKETTPSLERILQKNNWEVPYPRMLICKGEAEKVMEAPWMKRYSILPPKYEIIPWTEILQEERQAIQKKQNDESWIPEDLVPFQYETDLEPINSLGLRYQGELVGWVINHRLSPDTIRYTCSFVRNDLQKMGRIICLYAEACRRQLYARVPNGIWSIPFIHEFMAKFAMQRLAPYLNSIEETRGTFKEIGEKTSIII